MDYAFSYEIEVRDYELDIQGIVNNAIYLHYLEMTRHAFCLREGLSFADMHAKGLDPVLRKAKLEYLSPLRAEDKFLSCLNLARKGPRFIFYQDLFRLPDMVPVLRAEMTLVCLQNGVISRGDELAEVFHKYLS